MSPPLPQLFLAGTATLLTSFDFGTVIAGATSSALALDLVNGRSDGTAETAEDVTLSIRGRTASTTDPFSDSYRPVAESWFEVRITAAINGASPVSYPWNAFGRGRPFVVPLPIAATEGYSIEVRAVVPPGESDLSGELSLVLSWNSHAIPVELGHDAAGLRGILSGLGDGEASFLIQGFVLTASSTPDNNIQIGDGDAVLCGLPVTILAQAIATTDQDSAAATLAAGEAYPITLSLGTGGFTQTKGPKATAPLPATAWLPAPGGELLLGKIARPQAAGIVTADITESQDYGLFAMTGTGLTRILGSGQALADDNLVTYQRPGPITWTPSCAAARIWLVGAGGARVVTPTATPPSPRALALWGAVTSSSDITTLTDLRTYCRTRREEIRFRFGAVLAAGQYVYGATPDEGRLLLRVPSPVLAVLDDLGTTATAGTSLFDVEQWDGSDWVSLFSRSPDRRPALAYNAVDLRAYGRPTSTVLAPGTRLRAKCVTVPTASVAPSGAEVVLFAELE